MRKSRFTEQQIAFALRQAETGTKVSEVSKTPLKTVDQGRGRMTVTVYQSFFGHSKTLDPSTVMSIYYKWTEINSVC